MVYIQSIGIVVSALVLVLITILVFYISYILAIGIILLASIVGIAYVITFLRKSGTSPVLQEREL
jgi:hypothetical protein